MRDPMPAATISPAAAAAAAAALGAPPTAQVTRADPAVFVPSETVLYVRFADVDMMQIVHHAAYFHWLEQIRFKFLNDVLGVPFEQLLSEGVALPLTGCSMDFRRRLRFGDRPVGYVRVELFKQAKIALHYRIYDSLTGELVNTAVTTHCFLDAGQRLMLRTPKFFSAALALALERHPDCALAAGVAP
jgi:acyl-CoA thioester hydrolase